jgi:hypothetical protein
MHKLGLPFLVRYYKIFLKEEHSLIVIAEDNGIACGFHSGTERAEEHNQAIAKNKMRLAISIIPLVLKHPRMLNEIRERFRSLQSTELSYRVTEGPRGEYWAWLPRYKDPGASLRVLEIWHEMMKARGVQKVRFEVDLCNKRIADRIGLLKAEVLKEITLPDGRIRRILEINYNGNSSESFPHLIPKGTIPSRRAL